MRLSSRCVLLSLLILSACGGGSSGSGGGANLPDREPVQINDGPFEAYRTDHNGFSRVRNDLSTRADAQVLAQFDDADPADPAGYKNLIAKNEKLYKGTMTIEVLAEVDPGKGARAKRLLRLTADQAPLQKIGADGRTPSGTYYFRGQSFAWVTIDDGPLLSGRQERGLESLALNFDTGKASIDLRTEVSANSQVEIGLKARNLPFDVASGAYGGKVKIKVNNPDVTEAYTVNGHLRGSVGGRPGYVDDRHGLTTSGLYTARGTSKGKTVSVDGVYRGLDPNALP